MEEKNLCPTEIKNWQLSVFNNMCLIRKHFSKREMLRKYPRKRLTLKNGGFKTLMKNIIMLTAREYTAFNDPHIAVPMLKSTLCEVWEKEYGALDRTCRNKFRQATDVNQYLFRYWDIARGNFEPSRDIGKCYHIASVEDNECENDILAGKNKMICINDNENMTDYEAVRDAVTAALKTRYPEKCSFEQ